MEQEPPAAALARAQYWLRTVTNQELQTWQADLPLPITAQQNEASNKKIEQVIEEQDERRFRIDPEQTKKHRYRFELEEAEEWIRKPASRSDPTARPFADPYYWAGFQVIGW